MTTVETIELGVPFAQRAAEDRMTCETDNHNLHQKALTDYTRAFEMFSLTSTCEHNSVSKQLLQDKMTGYRDRKAIPQDYLTSSPSPRPQSIPGRTSEAVRTKPCNEEAAADHEDLQRLFTRPNLSTATNDSVPYLSDVVGLESVKTVLQEAAMLPEQFPDLFKQRRSWKTILLYGPPGVGKTYVSKAIAAESKSAFFNLDAGDLMAASVENCERVINDLFAAARRSGKMVLYFDDVDILFSTERTPETESLRRVKGQVLKELRRLQDSPDAVVFIATTRTPWLLEEAFLCRMDRRIHVGLPDAKSRTKIVEEMLREVSHTLSAEDIENIATECESYSCSDMKALAMDAEMEPLRIIQDSAHFRNIWVAQDGKRVRRMSPCSENDEGAMEMRHTDVQRNMLHIPAVTCLDFELALDRTKPTVGLETVEKHVDFTRRKGQEGY